MTARNWPWNMLGIDPTGDQRAIKRAYAARLKQTRPDEDPEGFQKLREARDDALWEAQFMEEETSGEEMQPAPPGAEAERLLPAEEPPPSDPPITEEELMRALQELPASSLRGETPSHDASSARSDDTEAPAAHIPQDAPPAGENPEMPEGPDAYEQAVQKLDDLLDSPWRDEWDLGAWRGFLREIDDLNLDERHAFQQEIAERLMSALKQADKRAEPEDRQRRRNAVLKLLDEEFGWSGDDRILYHALPYEDADRLSTLIRRIKAARGPESRVIPPAEEDPDFPLLDRKDLDDFFSASRSLSLHFGHGKKWTLGHLKQRGKQKIIAYYDESLADRQWKRPDWLWPGFLFSYVWAGWRRLYLKAFMLLGWTLGGLFLLYLARAGKNPDVYGLIHGESARNILTLCGLAAIAISHFWPATTGRQWVIEQMARFVAKADKRRLVGPERTKFLQMSGMKRSWLFPAFLGILYVMAKTLMTEPHKGEVLDPVLKPTAPAEAPLLPDRRD